MVYPHDCMADRELRLAASVQHYQRVPYQCCSPGNAFSKNQSTVYTEGIWLSHNCKVKKNQKSNYSESGIKIYSHIWRSWGFGLQKMNYEEIKSR